MHAYIHVPACKREVYMNLFHADISAFISNPGNVTSFPHLFTNTQCSGAESRLIQCTHNSSISQCVSGRVAFAQCETCEWATRRRCMGLVRSSTFMYGLPLWRFTSVDCMSCWLVGNSCICRSDHQCPDRILTSHLAVIISTAYCSVGFIESTNSTNP